MFTLKFLKFHEDNTRREVCVATPVYEKHQYPDGNWAVTIHKGPVLIEGTEYQVGNHLADAYDVCFVENQAGKTIDRIAGPKNP